ncbi:MAG: 2,3-bisphosphoglycerate-independent phosphoglycerate mutase [Phycisphaerae bacterium]|jgi:2,3-bisphosphoglycerate-independent phosphoglycerate mutase
MKRVIIIPSGAADEPANALDGQTPLTAAHTPNMDWIATNGRQGRVTTIPTGVSPGIEMAMLSLMGYDPRVEAVSRGPLEATASGLPVRPDQFILCCSLVTVTDGIMADDCAGHIGGAEAEHLIAALNAQVADDDCRFHGCGGHRALLVFSNVEDVHASCTPPHDLLGRPVASHRATGKGAKRIRAIMDQAHRVLANHEVNLVRSDLGDNPATDLWLWGGGRPRRLETFERRFGISACLVASTDSIGGLARVMGMDWLSVPPGAGTSDNPFSARAEAAVSALDTFDLVAVHVETPEDASRRGDAGAKTQAIESVDMHLVGPLLERLQAGEDCKILIAVDTPTSVSRRVHIATPPPFCLAGRGLQTVLNRPFSEANAAISDLQVDPGHELMEFFLRS